MHFNVSGLLQEQSGAARGYQIDDEPVSVDDAEIRRVSGSVRLLRTDLGIWVSALLDSSALCACSRCLAECTQPVRITLEEEALAEGVLEGSAAPSDGLSVDDNNILDMTEVVRQYFALGMPMNPVCRDGCKGICPACGINLNVSRCGCSIQTRDTRWAPLLELSASLKQTEVRAN